jgi:hypothetical protein
MTIFLWMIAREIRETRAALRSLKRELGGYAADGYPPPDPPTTDSQAPNVPD